MHSPRQREEVIDDLLLFEDIEFVRRAYRALLGREADAAGLDAQVAQLRDGSITKLQLLEALQSSAEGRDHGAQIAVVTHRRDTERITSAIESIPLLGPAFHWLWSFVGMPAQMQQQRRTIALLEDQLAAAHAASVERERELARTLRGHWGSLEDRLIQLAPRATTTTGRVARFYADFQDHFRGSDAQIRARLTPYLADVERLRHTGQPVIDLGCGRGEWLDMLRARGLSAVGIDANEAMVARCRANGLAAEHSDALAYLRRTESGSISVITGFHIAEHLAIESLLMLLEESLRVLIPGGFLILETPNPENVLMGACDFYIDPTHERPIPPVTLEFMARRSGFGDIELRRLNPAQAPDYSSDLAHAISRFTMASDYAIVAIKTPGC